MAHLSHVDPEEERFYRTYPKFPGVTAYAELLRSGKARGTWIDLVVAELKMNASQNVVPLIEATQADYGEQSGWMRQILLATLADTSLPEFTSLFAEFLGVPDAELRSWATIGLQNINTKEARTLLWRRQ